jgi:predicted phage terminase large subunit-like protein
MSFTFISAKVTDNYTLMKQNPQYVDQLKKLDRTERERKLYGNWNVRDEQGMFQRSWFRIVEAIPAGIELVRYWDRAATEKTSGNDPCYTSGCLGGHGNNGAFYIADMRRARLDPADNQRFLKNTASQDGRGVPIFIEQEPGSSGKDSIYHYVAHILPEYDAHGDRVTGSKINRAKPFAAQAEVGNVRLLRGNWNEEFLKEAANFPISKFKDQVDAASGCYAKSLGVYNNGQFFVGRAGMSVWG